LGELEAPPVVFFGERTLGDDCIGADHLEIEMWPERFFHEAELHQCGLEQDAATGQHGQEIGDVLTTDVYGWMAWVAAFEARQDTER
jgi:hypothetical protein